MPLSDLGWSHYGRRKKENHRLVLVFVGWEFNTHLSGGSGITPDLNHDAVTILLKARWHLDAHSRLELNGHTGSRTVCESAGD